MTPVASQEELIALVREKGPEFDEKDLADIGHVNRDAIIATVADSVTLGISAAAVLSSPMGVMGVVLMGAGVGGGLLGAYWARSVGAGETVAGLLEMAGMRRVGQVSAEGPYPAAVGHQVAHSYALWGFLASVAIGVVAAFAVGALIATGVGGLVLLGAAAGLGVLAGFYGTAISDALSSMGSRVGPIKKGSTDVFIGGKGAARWVDEAECSKDPPTQIIVEGSDTIFVNNLPLARVGHKLLCGAVIDEGEPSIIVDGTTRRCAIPKSEVPLWARVVVDLAILASLYKGLKVGTANKGVPQGFTETQFARLSQTARAGAGHLGDDIAVHGSRAAGTAKPTSDIDIAIRVSPKKFAELIRARFGTPASGSAKERTMLHAISTGKIQAGEAGLRGLRRQLAQETGMAVDISVIRVGGPFDKGPYIPLE